MKKVALTLLILALCFSVLACGKSNTFLCKIVLTDGTTKEFSGYFSVLDAYEENEVRGEKLFISAGIEVIDEITAIETYTTTGLMNSKIEFAEISFRNCTFSYNISNEDNRALIESFSVGDVVKVTGEIQEIFVNITCTGLTIESYETK